MESLDSIDEEKLGQLLRQEQTISLQIPEVAVCFKQHIPNVSFEKPLEVPPTSIIFFDRQDLARAIALSSNDIKGKHQRLLLTVYALGGKIFYKALAAGGYEANIVWPAPQPLKAAG